MNNTVGVRPINSPSVSPDAACSDLPNKDTLILLSELKEVSGPSRTQIFSLAFDERVIDMLLAALVDTVVIPESVFLKVVVIALSEHPKSTKVDKTVHVIR
jgi:hypothetical protein